MWTSSRSWSPARDISFKRLHHECFDCEHDGDEGESIGQDFRHVEQLEGGADLEAHAIGPAQKLDDQYDLPDQRQAGTRRGGEIRRQLRQDNMAEALPSAHAEHLRHLVETTI